MKFSVFAVLAAAASAHAWNNVTYTTEVVTAVTTFCPAATEITYGGTTYTVTEATTLTISNCPCTVTKPVSVISTVICHECSAAAPTNAPYPSKPGAASWPQNTTVPAAVPTGAASPVSSQPPLVTAGAGKAVAISGAGLAGLLGLALFVL